MVFNGQRETDRDINIHQFSELLGRTENIFSEEIVETKRALLPNKLYHYSSVHSGIDRVFLKNVVFCDFNNDGLKEKYIAIKSPNASIRGRGGNIREMYNTILLVSPESENSFLNPDESEDLSEYQIDSREITKYSLDRLRQTPYQVWVSNPKYFNDPFDPYVSVDTAYIPQEQIQNAIHTAQNDSGISEEEAQVYLSMLDEQFGGLRRFAHDTVRGEAAGGIRVHCFSEKKTSMTMWGRYADNHGGICLEYNTSDFPDDVLKNIYPVDYSESPLDLTMDLSDKNNPYRLGNLFRAYSTKHIEWKPEMEWRYILSSENDGGSPGHLENFPKPCCIYLGIKFPNDNVDLVMSLAEDLKIRVIKMCYDIGNYGFKECLLYDPDNT